MFRFTLFLCCLLLLAACGPDEAAIQQTVEREVAAAITSTLAAQSTATTYPTVTPFATATAVPSFTPTATIYPSATPYPTFTPTATPPPTSTPAPLPTRDPNAAAPPPPSAPINIEISLIQAMTRIRDGVNTLYANISGGNNSVNCQIIIPAYDNITNAPTFDVTGTDIVVQSAYGVYRQVITDLTTGNTAILAQDCREPYNNGIAEIEYGRSAKQGLVFELGDARSALDPALQSIGGN
jgi:hypothetical protein